ncbi:hypothetical protein Y026_5081 [Burkholderia pseudomallei TSV28]|nr:hypothetical protein Y026_5081 [Burkholderia pseudomallei TSV28]
MERQECIGISKLDWKTGERHNGRGRGAGGLSGRQKGDTSRRQSRNASRRSQLSIC